MRDKPYPGMGNVDKEEGLCLKKKKDKEMSFYFPGGFFMMSGDFMPDCDVEANDILVFSAISSFADNTKRTCYPTQETISKRARRNLRLTMETIKHLVKIGWLTKIRRGLNKPNNYIVHFYKKQKFTEEERREAKNWIDENRRFSR